MIIPRPLAAVEASPRIISLPTFVKSLATSVLGDPYCYEEIVEGLNLGNVQCLKFGFSKGLGLGIVFGGCIVKLPQIFVILRARSARGISLPSYVLETFAYLVTVAYNLREGNAFSTWGESLSIAAQNVKEASQLDSPDAVWVSASCMSLLMALTIPTILLSRLPQIYTTFRHGGSGSLSLFTVFNYFIGTAGRVYTTYQEVDDKLILLGNVLAFLLNAIILAQTLYYRKRPVKEA
ncbi:hypothetical protein L0F63_005232 [Massospora cicadina]|nr:hypothetical protein L0F63_005232 [Massospora cicadina]